MKKIGVVLSVILTSLLSLVACGNPYDGMALKLSSKDADVSKEITLTLEDKDGVYVSSEITVTGEVTGAGKGISEKVIFPTSTMQDKTVGIKNISYDGNKTIFTLYGKAQGKTTLEFKGEGNLSQKLTVNVEIAIQDLAFKENIIPAIKEGESYNLNQNPRSLITFTPENTSQDIVQYEIVQKDADKPVSTYAYIKDGVLYTIKGATFPKNDDNVNYITLKASSPVSSTINDSINIPVLNITNEFNVLSSADTVEGKVTLTPNSKTGAYDMIMSTQLVTEDSATQYFIGNREISIKVGKDKQEHDKYRVVCNNENAEFLSVKAISSAENAGGYRSDFANFNISAINNPNTNKPLRVTFDVEYIGSEQENGGDLYKYEGLFTQTISFDIIITSVPVGNTITINNQTADEVSLDIYDVYLDSEGTRVEIKNQFTALDLAFSLQYEAEGYSEGFGTDALSLYYKGQFITDKTPSFKNGDAFYLKHNYSVLNADYKPYLLITFSYSFKPESGDKANYKTYTITKKINLNFFKSIDKIELNDLALDISSDEYITLFEFPKNYVAENYVRNITSSNKTIYEIAYDKNIVKIRANQNQLCGLASAFSITTTNGIVSNYVTVESYLPSVYTTDSPLYLELIDADDRVYYFGYDNTFEEASGYDKQIINLDGAEYAINTFSVLALETNSQVELNVYHLLHKDASLTPVLKNYNVSISGLTGGQINWDKQTGVLSTFSSVGTHELNITLMGRKLNGNGTLENVTVTKSLEVYIFEPINNQTVQLNMGYKDVYIQNSLSVFEQENDEDKFNIEFITFANGVSVPFEDREDVFGKLTTEVKISDDLIKTYNFTNGAESISVYASDLIITPEMINKEVNPEGQNTVNGVYSLIFSFNDLQFIGPVYKDAVRSKFNDIMKNKGWTIKDLWNDLFKTRVVIEGDAVIKQFDKEASKPFSVSINNRVQSERILSNVDTETGIDFEYKGGKLSGSQTINYSVYPNNATNKNVMVLVTNKNGAYVHAKVNGKCSVCDCVFKDFGVCNYHNHEALEVCTADDLIITLTDTKITFMVTNASLVGKLNVKVIPVDSLIARYEYQPEKRIVNQIENLVTGNRVLNFEIKVNDGSLANPFEIRDKGDFVTMLNDIKAGNNASDGDVEEGFDAFHYVQVKNINIEGVDFSKYYSNNFKGSYTGMFSAKSKKIFNSIYGVVLDGASANMGIFGTLSGTLTYVNVESAYVDANVKTDANIGILVGKLNATGVVEMCRVTSDSFRVNATAGNVNVGGLVGYAEGGAVQGYYYDSAEDNEAVSINNNDSNSVIALSLKISSGVTLNAGGVIGYASSTTISQLRAVPNIFFDNDISVGGNTLGGIVGYASNTTIDDVEVYPVLIGHNNVGGVLGYGDAVNINKAMVIMVHNSNMKNIIAGYNNVGGLAGQLMNGATISYSYLQGLTTDEVKEGYSSGEYCGNVVLMNGATATTYVGGLFGYSTGTITLNSVMFKGDVTSYSKVAGSYALGIGYVNNTEIADIIINGRITAPNSNVNKFALIQGSVNGATETYANISSISNGYVIVNGKFAQISSNVLTFADYVEGTTVVDYSAFAWTNGVYDNDIQDGIESTPVDGTYVDTSSNEMFKEETDATSQKVTYTQIAKWFVSDKINDGHPVLVVLEEKGDFVVLKTLYSAVATLNVKVLDFNESAFRQEQNYIKVSDKEVVLFYNQPYENETNENLNKYSLKIDSINNNDVIELTVSVVDLFTDTQQGFVELEILKQYSIISSSSIVSYDSKNNVLTTNGTGTATLTFNNIYDEGNSFVINIQVINGITDFVVTNQAGEEVSNYYYNDTEAEGKSTDNPIKVAVDNGAEYFAGFENVIGELPYTAYKGGYKALFVGEDDISFRFNGNLIELDETSTSDVTTTEEIDGVTYTVITETIKGTFKLNGVKVDSTNIITYTHTALLTSTNDDGTTSHYKYVYVRPAIELDFNNISSISLVGKVAGEMAVMFTPYVLYGETKIDVIRYNKFYALKVVDKAKSLDFSEPSATIKPESSVEDLYFELVTSDLEESINLSLNITNISSDTNTLYTEIWNNLPESGTVNLTSLLIMKYYKVNVSPVNSQGLYTIKYRVSLKMNSDVYYDMFSQTRYTNPLESPWVFNITLTAASNTEATDAYKFTIEGNELDKLDTFLYQTEYKNEDVNTYQINPAYPVTTKLAPNSYGILDITALREMNNVSYVEITTSDSKNVSLTQLYYYYVVEGDAGGLNTDMITYKTLTYDAILIKDGIRLWNITDNSGGKYEFNNRYYVLVRTGQNIAENSTLQVNINAYDYSGNLLENSRTFDISIEPLPRINLSINGEENPTLALNEYYPLTITASNVESDITWNFSITNGTTGYDLNGNSTTAGLLSGVKLYTLENGLYTLVNSSDVVDLTKQYYIGIGKDQPLTKGIKFTLTGGKYVNDMYYEISPSISITTVIATVEGVNVNNTQSNNTFFLPTGTSSALTGSVILNASAMNVISRYQLVEEDSNIYFYDRRGNNVTASLTAYEKNILTLYSEIANQISGVSKQTRIELTETGISTTQVGETKTYHDFWMPEQLDNNGVLTFTGNIGEFTGTYFKGSQITEPHYINVTALAIGTGRVQFMPYFIYENGVPQVVDNDDNTEGKFCFEHIFTISVIDNSTADHPNPIYSQDDLKNVNIDQTVTDQNGEIVRPHYILMNDINLVNWEAIPFTAASLDGNSYTINIHSFDMSAYKEANSVSLGVFSSIHAESTLKNVTFNVAPLLINKNEQTKPSDYSTWTTPLDFSNKTSVKFGLITPENNGVITNTKVINTSYPDRDNSGSTITKNGDNFVLYVKTSNFVNGQVAYNEVSPFVVDNNGSISYSYVGQNYATEQTSTNAGGVLETKFKHAISGNKNKEFEDKTMYGLNIYAGNNVAGLVVNNINLLSNSYVYNVSLTNTTATAGGSATGGVVTNNHGKIYASFNEAKTISKYRATDNYLKSNGSIGGFVYYNDERGVIENAYSVIKIDTYSVATGGFVYQNLGAIKNAYTTSINTSNDKITEAHGWFVSDKVNYGTLENCYYFVQKDELGLDTSDDEYYFDNDILREIDPATPIVTDVTVNAGGSTNFSSKSSFEGFPFVTANNYDGIWYEDATGKAPRINAVLTETSALRQMANAVTADGKVLTESEAMSAGGEITYNYEYPEYQLGKEENPIVVGNAKDFLNFIIGNSKRVTWDGGTVLNVFGKTSPTIQQENGEEGEDNEDIEGRIYDPEYVRLTNDIDFSEVPIDEKYKMLSGQLVALSEITFNGILAGNGMTISGINLNNTSELVVEDYGLFKQIGLTEEQRNAQINGVTNVISNSPVVYNLTLQYDEVKYKNARKVGVLAGSIYEATVLYVNVIGNQEDYLEENAVILGGNLAGGLAGYIAGESTKVRDINLSNVRVKVNTNRIANVTDEYRNDTGFYDKFVSADDNSTTQVISATFDETTITKLTNLSSISYAGALAGIVNIPATVSDNAETSKTAEDELDVANSDNRGKYGYLDYHAQPNERYITAIKVTDNLDIRADIAGGVVGGLFNTRLDNTTLVLTSGEEGEPVQNNIEAYQSIFAYGYGGGIAGQLYNSVLDQVMVQHAEKEQLIIDEGISALKSVSKTDLFTTLSTNALNVSIAIGGIAGYSQDSAIVYSGSKVNVQNIKAKIAGGIVGFAKNYNNISYSFTTGNVMAKEIVGGIVGFYLQEGFDFYLFNTFGVNVWSEDIIDYLKVNSMAYYKNQNYSVIEKDEDGEDVTKPVKYLVDDITSVRMAEIGNSLAVDGNGNLLKSTNNLTGADLETHQLYKYIGSVFGKITYNAGVYDFGTISSTGAINSGNNTTHNKDLFVTNVVTKTEEDDDDEYTVYNGDNLVAVNLYKYYNEDVNGYYYYSTDKDGNLVKVRLTSKNVLPDDKKDNGIDEEDKRIDKIFTNGLKEILVRIDVDEDNNEKFRHHIYTNDYFYNVYSSTYSAITTSGEVDKHNFNTVINEGSGALITDNVNETETDKNKGNLITYPTTIGNQYYVSYITGDYYVSNSSAENYKRFEDAFADSNLTGFAYLPTQTTATKDVIAFEKALYGVLEDNTYIGRADSQAKQYTSSTAEGEEAYLYLIGYSGASNVWYVNNGEIFPTFTRGKSLNYEVLTGNEDEQTTKDENGNIIYKTHSDLDRILSRSTRGRTFNLNTEGGAFYLVLDRANPQQYATPVRATIAGIPDASGNPVIKVILKGEMNESMRASSLFTEILDATFINIDFEFVLASSQQYNNKNEYFGILAREVRNSTFTNCDFKFTGDSKVSFVTADDDGYDITTDAVTKAGLVFGLANGVRFDYCSLKIDDDMTIENAPLVFGGFIGESFDLTVKNFTATGGTIDIASVRNTNEKAEYSYGGLFGVINYNDGASTLTNINYSSETRNKEIVAKVSATTAVYETSTLNLGGYIGKMTGGANTLSNTYINQDLTFDLKNNWDNIVNVGGFVGSADNANFKNLLLGAYNPSNLTLISDQTTTVATNASTLNFGGLAGAVKDSSLGVQANALNLVNADITVTLNNAENESNIGGVFGSAESTNINKVINAKNIVVSGSAKTVNIGGIVGNIKDTNINECYNVGDIVTKGDASVTPNIAAVNASEMLAVGGIAGYAEANSSNAYTIKDVTTYGDVYYADNNVANKIYYYGGIIGYATNNYYKLDHAITFTNFINASGADVSGSRITPFGYFNGETESTDTISRTEVKDKDENDNEIIMYNHNIKLSNHISDNCMYINELHLDLADSTSKYAYYGKWLVDIYNTLDYTTDTTNDVLGKGALLSVEYNYLTKTTTEEEITTPATQSGFNIISWKITVTYETSIISNLLEEFVGDTSTAKNGKFNITGLSKLEGTISGFKFIYAIDGPYNAIVSLTSDVTIDAGAVLTAAKPSKVTISLQGGHISTNNGNLANMAVVFGGGYSRIEVKDEDVKWASNFMGTNNGYVHNVVVYGEDVKEIATNQAGFVYENNGYLCQVGTNITYSDNTSLAGKNYAGIAYTNNGAIEHAYAISHLLYADGEGVTAGVAYTNNGVITNVLVGGVLNDNSPFAYEGNGSVNNCLIDTSIFNNVDTEKYTSSQMATYESLKNQQFADKYSFKKENDTDKYLWKHNNTLRGTNSGYPYFKNGIVVPSYANRIEDGTTYVLEYFDKTNGKSTKKYGISYYQSTASEYNEIVVISTYRTLRMWAEGNKSNLHAQLTRDLMMETVRPYYSFTANNFSGEFNGQYDSDRYAFIGCLDMSKKLDGSDNTTPSFIGNIAEKGIVSATFIYDLRHFNNLSTYAGFANTNKGVIYGCINYSSGGNSLKISGKAGGITVDNTGVIYNCESHTSLTTQGSDPIGGITATASGIIGECKVYAHITGEHYVGGIVGQLTGSTTLTLNEINPHGTGTGHIDRVDGYEGVVITGDKYVGGIVGGKSADGGYATNSSTGNIVNEITIKYGGFGKDDDWGWIGEHGVEPLYKINNFGSGINITDIKNSGVFRVDNGRSIYRRNFNDLNVHRYNSDTDNNKTWFGPTNGETGNGVTANGFTFITTNNKGSDDSVYYSTLGSSDGGLPNRYNKINYPDGYSDDLIKYAVGYNPKTSESKAIADVGLLSGVLTDIKGTMTNSTITSRTHNAKGEKIESGDVETSFEENKGKIILERFMHYFYIFEEPDSDTGVNIGMLAIEFTFYFDSQTSMPSIQADKGISELLFKLRSNNPNENPKENIGIRYDYQKYYYGWKKFGEDLTFNLINPKPVHKNNMELSKLLGFNDSYIGQVVGKGEHGVYSVSLISTFIAYVCLNDERVSNSTYRLTNHEGEEYTREEILDNFFSYEYQKTYSFDYLLDINGGYFSSNVPDLDDDLYLTDMLIEKGGLIYIAPIGSAALEKGMAAYTITKKELKSGVDNSSSLTAHNFVWYLDFYKSVKTSSNGNGHYYEYELVKSSQYKVWYNSEGWNLGWKGEKVQDY